MPHTSPDRPLHGDARDELDYTLDRGEVLETPQEVLRTHDLTPQAYAFVRNNNPYPPGADTLAPVPASGVLEIGGLVERELALNVADLDRLPRHEVEAVMQCAGNGRAFYRDAQDIDGHPWVRGGVMNGLWGGVRLADVLGDAGIRPEARFVTATGADGGCGFEKSVPLADALERGLLVRTLGGEPLAGAHGGPLRLLMPGFFGTVNVKWLRRLTLTDHESPHEAQQQRYRVVNADGTSRPCWHQPIKSVIWSPLPGESTTGTVLVSGVAWNDGSAPVSRVELSVDGGASWQDARLGPLRGPFAWRRWDAQLTLASGAHEVMARATDDLGRTQPLHGDEGWNPDGYEFHAVDRVRFTVGD
jgi:DMSO/TMAO reductase YedYZ molybdopterin-dependent catalytic subunit